MRLLLVLLISMIVRSCDLGTSLDNSTDQDGANKQGCVVATWYRIAYELADTLGRTKAVFKSGEDFIATLAITNLTRRGQIYAHTGPVMVFSVRSGDSTVTSSTDGLAWPQVVVLDTLRAGETLRYTWRGPNSEAKIPHVSLTPGAYTVVGEFTTMFGGKDVVDPDPIAFVIE